jgi:hypothetical protein
MDDSQGANFKLGPHARSWAKDILAHRPCVIYSHKKRASTSIYFQTHHSQHHTPFTSGNSKTTMNFVKGSLKPIKFDGLGQHQDNFPSNAISGRLIGNLDDCQGKEFTFLRYHKEMPKIKKKQSS